MAKTLKLEIITPETIAYSGDAEFVLIPAELGEMGVYPMHTPLITRINPGELVVTQKGEKLHMAIGEGFAEITQTNIRILADMAITEHAIDEKAAEKAVERAEQRLREAKVGDEDVAMVKVALAKSLAQLKVKRRRPK
jgi:F-type H+-transporting ATPase subunit epsilon